MDTLTPEERSERMRRIQGKNTKPEIAVRRLVHGMGYRYRLHVGGLPGRPDMVFARRRKVIFVHGCFWHRHASARCALARLPKSRLEFWIPKLDRNRQRDMATRRKLVSLGWKSLVVWECEINKLGPLKRRIGGFLGT